MSYDYDDTDDGPVRVLWGKVGVFLAAGLLLFLLGRQCAPQGVSQDEFTAVQEQASEYQRQRDQLQQQIAQAGSAASEPPGDGESEPTDDETSESDGGSDSEDPSEDATEEDSEGETSGDTYTVEAGDTLNEIAAQFGVDADDLADANDIDDPENLIVGQELEIP